MKRDDYISWDEFFLGIAKLAAERSKDPNTQVGACIVKNNLIIGVGYNGFPIGCSDDHFPWIVSDDFIDSKYTYVCHAELNAIINATDRRSLVGSTLYVTLFPCHECTKLIIQSGIKNIKFSDKKYWATDSAIASRKMLDSSGVNYEQIV